MTRPTSVWLSAAAVLCGLGATLLWRTLGSDADSTRGPGDADYCNVLLVPSLAESIGLDLPTRIRVAKKGEDLLCVLRNGSGHVPVVVGANEVGDRMGSDLVARYGRETREMLSVDARRAFEQAISADRLVRVRFWTEKSERGSVAPDRYYLTYGWYETERKRTGQKSLRALEQELRRCYRWIPDADVADRLLDHQDEEVSKAADRWWDEKEAASGAHVGPAGTAEPSGRIAEDVRRHEEAFERRSAEARLRIEESRRLMEEGRARRAAEREAFRERSRARQEQVRKRIEDARQGDE